MRKNLSITRREAGLMLTGLAAAAAWPARAAAPGGFCRHAGYWEIPPDGVTGYPPGRGLRAMPAKAFLRGKNSPATDIWSFDCQPYVLSAKIGEECVIPVHNGTDRPLSLHWHGARTMPNAMDGAGGLTQTPIPPGGDFTYRFTPQEAGTWLIRPCILGGTSEPAGRGISGLFIVRAAGLPPVEASLNFIVDDWLLSERSLLTPFTKTTRSRLGNLLTVNGAAAPYDFDKARAEAPENIAGALRDAERKFGGRLIVRLANACNARSFRLRFDRMKAYVIAVDGQPTDAFEPLHSSLPFSPGNRYDILIELPESGPDSAITALLGQELPLAIFKPRTRGAALPADIEPPQPNPLLPQKIRLQDALRFDISLDAIFSEPPPGTRREEQVPAAWALNGLPPESRKAKPLFSVKSGRPVVLALHNTTAIPQPIHIHGHSFRLLHPYDDGWDPFWIDTLLIPAQTTVRIAFIAGSAGKWLVASTIAEHFDTGLWGWFEVV